MRNHCHLLFKRVANKKSIKQKLATNTTSKKIYLQRIKKKIAHAYKSICEIVTIGKKVKEKKIIYKLQLLFLYIQRYIQQGTSISQFILFASSSSFRPQKTRTAVFFLGPQAVHSQVHFFISNAGLLH